MLIGAAVVIAVALIGRSAKKTREQLNNHEDRHKVDSICDENMRREERWDHKEIHRRERAIQKASDALLVTSIISLAEAVKKTIMGGDHGEIDAVIQYLRELGELE